MRNNTISVRLSDQEKTLLEDMSNRLDITPSQCIRVLLHQGEDPRKERLCPVVGAVLSRIYVRLGELGLETDRVTEEVMRLCQIL